MMHMRLLTVWRFTVQHCMKLMPIHNVLFKLNISHIDLLFLYIIQHVY
jgi:hypothetical protein